MEQCDGGAVEEGCIDEKRSHHPAEVGGPSHDIPLPHVHVSPGVCGSPQWGGMCPGYGFWVPYIGADRVPSLTFALSESL